MNEMKKNDYTPLDPAFNRLPSEGYRAHLLGVGGVAMTAVAGLLKDSGWQVSGSDKGVYPPMSDLLKELGLEPREGYAEDSLPEQVDLAVIGNVVSRSFPVLKTLAQRQLPFLSLPQTLSQLFLQSGRNLVVAGCHGKSSTTALAAKIFDFAGWEPGFLIGGATLDFPRPWRLGAGDWFIIEGDEYDSAFFNKEPKFLHYRPQTVILTSIEFDHGDIYPDLPAVVRAFEQLAALVPPDGRLIAWGDSPLVRQVAGGCRGSVEFYGQSEDSQWRVLGLRQEGFSSSFELAGPGGFYARLSLPRPGVYNVLNAAAAAAAFVGSGGDGRCLAPALASFQGVRRRQQRLGTFGGVELIDDFAHHPTAVRETLGAVRQAFPGRRLLVAFEARSNTSRRAVFQDDYAWSLAGADQLFLRRVADPHKAPEGDRLDMDKLAASAGPPARIFDDGLALGEALAAEAVSGDVILVMSNGSFDGLTELLIQRLGR